MRKLEQCVSHFGTIWEYPIGSLGMIKGKVWQKIYGDYAWHSIHVAPVQNWIENA